MRPCLHCRGCSGRALPAATSLHQVCERESSRPVQAAAVLLLMTAPPSPIWLALLLGTELPSPLLFPTRKLPKLAGLLL